jgi:mannose-6-phosphate isomerase
VTAPDFPLRFRRRLLPKVWGARRLEAFLGIAAPSGELQGESWELSDHPSGESVVAEGPLAGSSLRALVAADPRALVGDARLAAGSRFPLLVKLVDAGDRLSVQVHPDDAAAASLGERDGGKNEAWYVVGAEPDAVLWVGLAPGRTREDLERAAGPREFEACLRELRPRAGDAIAIPAGTVHCIGAGVTLCEIQQTSDVTYRLYDWGRPTGPSRPLHRAESFAVARLEAAPPLSRPEPMRAGDGNDWAELPSPGSFRWRVGRIARAARGATGLRCRVLVALEGSGALETEAAPGERVALRPGDAALVPAAGRGWRLQADSPMRVIEAEPLP